MGVGHGALELMAWKANIMSIISGLNDHRQTLSLPFPKQVLSVSLFLLRGQALALSVSLPLSSWGIGEVFLQL